VSDLTNKSSLTPGQRRLLELMQELNFGRIENLFIERGDPWFEPAPRIVQKFKIGSGENGPRPEGLLEDFWLKRQVIDLFELLTRVNTGKVLTLDVKNGLPFAVDIERTQPKLHEESHA
jgi:hypothetical protein